MLTNCENKLQEHQQIILNDPIGYRFTMLRLLLLFAQRNKEERNEFFPIDEIKQYISFY